MVGRKRHATRSSARRGAAQSVPTGGEIYLDMLAEAGVNPQELSSPERPLKRRRAGPSKPISDKGSPSKPVTKQSKPPPPPQPQAPEEEEDDDEDVEFQDVLLPQPTMQTMELESDDEDEDDDVMFEDVDFTASLQDLGAKAEEPKALELNLTAHQTSTSQGKKAAERRKPITREERKVRTDIHKAHLLCLLSHAARRNHWCNDGKVQDYLQPHLTDKTVNYLTPGAHLPQFGQTESLKTGLKQAEDVWKTKYEITERGLRRALWAEDPEQLQEYEPPEDMESCLDREDFREAAKKLQGSRDVGAQLYCALLRGAGVRARLVCSLQPLACTSGAPSMPKPKQKPKKGLTKAEKNEKVLATLAKYQEMASAGYGSPTGASSARRRLGHPNATAYNFTPTISPPKPQPVFETRKRIKESLYPVYWVEVLDVGHQKWQPVDAVVTHTFWKPKALEPPITDKENFLSYVIAFEADGTAKDVTRRYAKAYTAKTRRSRVETVSEGGDAWWRRVMKLYGRRRRTDLDQIEDNELVGIEAREPMPRNVQDFKDHPVFALERHLRRNEVLVPGATPSGTVAAGSRGPLEKIYRRRDVRVARSADKWYRLGREVKPLEIPVKWLPKKIKPKNPLDDDYDQDVQDDAGTPVYTEDQTELYEPSPVRNGIVPKNKFGNIDVYVPSMVPKGGIHIIHEHAARAAFLAGVDYAPALTGFSFKGRHGTAVLNGIVIAKENEEGVRTIIESLGGLEQELEDERRRHRAFKAWRKFLMALRIREQIWSGVDPDERKAADDKAAKEAQIDQEIEDASSDVTEEFDMDVDDDMGGGFMME
ncbi:xeroderma pigmentosum group c complementing factor [Fusarium heterosporum]|uniref:Xeroderma pigmentosum group c complementing factor n=1 Tax=Fusarium heterosporum TaxID=42747 RepID=A0A8H5TJF7_FUSHE|nr:xeroderma pigmentosum group c complementing factor [Fusarium heterosporum]